MATPKYHGILGAAYSTDSGVSWTTINKIVEGDQSRAEPGYPDDSPTDAFGNPYDDVKYWTIQLAFLDETAGSALETEHSSDSQVRLRLDLDNAAQLTMTADHLVRVIDMPIESIHEGRKDGYTLGEGVRVPDSDVTIA